MIILLAGFAFPNGMCRFPPTTSSHISVARHVWLIFFFVFFLKYKKRVVRAARQM